MLQVSVLKSNPDWVKERLSVKNFKQIDLVDAIVALDDERKSIQVGYDNAQAGINSLSKEIGKSMSSGLIDQANAFKKQVAEFKEQAAACSEKLALVEKELYEALVQLPNLPAKEVIKSPEDLIAKLKDEVLDTENLNN